jgi:hypothetical protein
LLCAVASSAWGAAPVGYAQATGYYKQGTRPTLYQPLNLLDGREATQWCSPTSDPLSEKLTFGFKGNARVDELRIYTGNGFDDSTFKEYSRAKKFSISGPSGALTFTVADERGLQSVALNPPLEGAQFTLEILDQYPAPDVDLPVCITDIVFYSEGKALNGSWLTPKLKYDRNRASVLGTWFSGSEGAPDKFLSFYFDGTFRFVHMPFDSETKPKEMTGEYNIAGGHVTLAIPGTGRVTARVSKEGAASGSAGHSLKLDGEVPAELKVPWRDRF